MSATSPIEWTDSTWNPIVGCSIVSPGCTHCYAMRHAARIERMNPGSHYDGTTKKVNGNAVWTGKLALAPNHILHAPLSWRKPKRIFVNSMGDLFHEDVPDEAIDRVFAVMALTPQHTYQVLTKRGERMRIYSEKLIQNRLRDSVEPGAWPMTRHHTDAILDPSASAEHRAMYRAKFATLPLPNVWLGVSVEDQTRWNERMRHLSATPAAVRFVSVEPMLGEIICGPLQGIDWIICGGESGAKARPMHPDWARSLRDQCAAADVPFFFKQWGAWRPHKPKAGGDLGGDVRRGTVRIVHPTGQSDVEVSIATGGRSTIPGSRYMERLGKKAAGRLLDGVEHNAMPVRT